MATDYEKLHADMQGLGFYRFVIETGSGKGQMALPTGSYRGWSENGIDVVAASIKRAADRTGKLNKVFCAQVSDSRMKFDSF